MQDIREVLRNKEEQLERLQKEIEALRFSLLILEEEERNHPKMGSRSADPVFISDNGTRPGASLKHFP